MAEEDSYPKSAKKICKEFYDLVEKRKDALVRQLLSSPKDITTSFTPKQKHLASFLKEAEKYCKQEKDRYGIDTDDFAFAIVNKGSSSFLPYLCFQFFEVFCSTNRNVERFLFFEIYYTGGIFSVLMRRGRYDSGNEGFAAFDMGRREWSLAKAQISFWQGFLKTKTDVIYYLSYPQQVLLDYFTHGSDHELMYILKRLHMCYVLWKGERSCFGMVARWNCMRSNCRSYLARRGSRTAES